MAVSFVWLCCTCIRVPGMPAMVLGELMGANKVPRICRLQSAFSQTSLWWRACRALPDRSELNRCMAAMCADQLAELPVTPTSRTRTDEPVPAPWLCA